jgi:hypothetical protein
VISSLFTEVPRIGILRTSSFGHSRKFVKNNALKGTKFIADSSPIANKAGMSQREESAQTISKELSSKESPREDKTR